MAELIITIDGPAAGGKSTVARLIAKKLSASFLDTGAMYRAVTLAAMKAGVDMNNENQLLAVIEKTKFQFTIKNQTMLACIDGIDVSEQIRTPEVTAKAHYIASSPKVRAKLVELQRQFAAKEQKIVTEGRDQGTVAFPAANVKFYLTADLTERAKRRQAELREKGVDSSLEQIQASLEKRDRSDRNRTVGPLKIARDAIIIDTTTLTIEQVVEKILTLVKEKCPKKY